MKPDAYLLSEFLGKEVPASDASIEKVLELLGNIKPESNSPTNAFLKSVVPFMEQHLQSTKAAAKARLFDMMVGDEKKLDEYSEVQNAAVQVRQLSSAKSQSTKATSGSRSSERVKVKADKQPGAQQLLQQARDAAKVTYVDASYLPKMRAEDLLQFVFVECIIQIFGGCHQDSTVDNTFRDSCVPSGRDLVCHQENLKKAWHQGNLDQVQDCQKSSFKKPDITRRVKFTENLGAKTSEWERSIGIAQRDVAYIELKQSHKNNGMNSETLGQVCDVLDCAMHQCIQGLCQIKYALAASSKAMMLVKASRDSAGEIYFSYKILTLREGLRCLRKLLKEPATNLGYVPPLSAIVDRPLRNIFPLTNLFPGASSTIVYGAFNAQGVSCVLKVFNCTSTTVGQEHLQNLLHPADLDASADVQAAAAAAPLTTRADAIDDELLAMLTEVKIMQLPGAKVHNLLDMLTFGVHDGHWPYTVVSDVGQPFDTSDELKNGTISPAWQPNYTQHLHGAVEFLHDHEFVHRDISIFNVVVVGPILKLIDYAFAVELNQPVDYQGARLFASFTVMQHLINNHRSLPYTFTKDDDWCSACMTMMYAVCPEIRLATYDREEDKPYQRVLDHWKTVAGSLNAEQLGRLNLHAHRDISLDAFRQAAAKPAAK